MTADSADITALAEELAGKPPRVIIKRALALYPNLAVAFSGAEDVALIDLICQIQPGITVFTLDTGRLHPETYRFLEVVRERYPIRLEILAPDPERLEALVRDKGLFSFFRDGHQECCGIRKVAPLRRKLLTVDAWMTGQRRDQGTTRGQVAEAEYDSAFSTAEHPIVKFNPLAGWTSEQVWNHIGNFDVPVNELHRQGFVSIGCEPCTRPILPHQQEREGRWWWEQDAKKECGLHGGNLRIPEGS